MLELLSYCVLRQVNEDSGNRRPIMLEAVDNPSSGTSTSRRDEAESSSSSASVAGGKGSGEDSQSTSQDKPSKKAKKDKQDKESSGNNLSWQWNVFNLVSKNNWFCFDTLHDWLKKFLPLLRLIRSENKTNRNSLTHIFPRFTSSTCSHFAF